MKHVFHVLAALSAVTGCADVLGVDFDDKHLAQTRRQVLTDPELTGFAFFGFSVDIAGDHMLIGAAPERAYIARKQTDSTWALIQELRSPRERFPKGFGGSVAISGDWAIVGDWGNTTTAVPGEAFVFKRGPDDQFQATGQRLDAETRRRDGDWFAFSLALDGDIAAIGAWGDNEFGAESGAVYVYSRIGDDWRLENRITLPNAAASDKFGHSLALDGDTLVVSAPGRDRPFGGQNTGAAYVYSRTTRFDPESYQELWPSGRNTSEYWMTPLDLSGNLLLTGAPEANERVGVAYAFERTAGEWNETPTVLPRGSESSAALAQDAHFGASVAVSGNRAVVTGRDGVNLGAAFVYERKQASWSLVYQVASDSAEMFGFCTALRDRTIAIGAPEADPAGAVYIFTLP